jgi:hypothetical protein
MALMSSTPMSSHASWPPAGFAEPFIQAIVADLQDKYQVASSTWMTTIAAKYIAGFHQSVIEDLALADPWENPQP